MVTFKTKPLAVCMYLFWCTCRTCGTRFHLVASLHHKLYWMRLLLLKIVMHYKS